jgi:hypothetical protein
MPVYFICLSLSKHPATRSISVMFLVEFVLEFQREPEPSTQLSGTFQVLETMQVTQTTSKGEATANGFPPLYHLGYGTRRSWSRSLHGIVQTGQPTRDVLPKTPKLRHFVKTESPPRKVRGTLPTTRWMKKRAHLAARSQVTKEGPSCDHTP